MSEKSSEIRRFEESDRRRMETERRRRKKRNTTIWLAIGATFLVILLILWLTFADLTGDTDVAAFISPQAV